MEKAEKVNYWIVSAENDWKVAGHLVEKGDYPYALFFGHLTVEKLLKALIVKSTDDIPPYKHRLVLLADRAGLSLSEDQSELLEIITDFNTEARYPDEKFSFFKKCTREYTEEHMRRIGDLREWLLRQTK